MAFHDAPGTSRDLRHQSTASIQDGRPPLEIGTELFRSVFQGQVRTLFDKSLGKLEMSPSLGLRLKIKIDPNDEDTVALADLPWELLCDGETEEFFALSRQTSLVRYLDVPRPSQPIPFTPPLRILAVGASPKGMPQLDVAEEARRLDDLNQGSSGVHVRFLPHASAGTVREALAGDTFNVLHFMGHGAFDPASGEGMLAFEGSDGSLDLVSGKAFATKLRDLRSLGVVVLNACETARARHEKGGNPFRGVATALVLGGLPAVVAMQRPISDTAAVAFSTAFYRNLASGDSIDEALTEGRQAIHSVRPEQFEWATPVLFLRTPKGNIFVAQAAERPEEKELPAPVPPVAPPVVSPAPLLEPPKGRGIALKIAAGAASTVAIVFVLAKALPWHEAAQPSGDTSTTQEPLTSGLEPGPQTEKRSADLQTARIGTASKPKPHETSSATGSPPPVAPAVSPTPELKETVASKADLSSLSAQVVSITRSDNGLRVTVSFKNTSDLPLAEVLDLDSSGLSDEKGMRYGILDSDLGDSARLQLGAGSASRHTFDFQDPVLGSKKFFLALSTQGGHGLKIGGQPILLSGDSP